MAAPDAHRDKRAKAGPVLYPMDEPLLRKCDALMKNLAKKSQARKTLRTQRYPMLTVSQHASNGCDSAVAPLSVQVELGEVSKIIHRRDS